MKNKKANFELKMFDGFEKKFVVEKASETNS